MDSTSTPQTTTTTPKPPLNTNQMVSLVTLNSSDDSTRSNSSLASSSHSNIDLIIDPSAGTGLVTSSHSPKQQQTRYQTADLDDQSVDTTTSSTSVGGGNNLYTEPAWSPTKTAQSAANLYRRLNSTTSIYGTPRRQTSFLGSAGTNGSSTPSSLANLLASFDDYVVPNSATTTTSTSDDLNEQMGGIASSQMDRIDQECSCVECGSYCGTYSMYRGEAEIVCETCMQKRWQDEINELLKYKTCLEAGVRELRRYLSAKKNQCNENIKSSQQIKKFINMTMQQIKRKVELDLENKRDELFNSIDAFVENQKK